MQEVGLASVDSEDLKLRLGSHWDGEQVVWAQVKDLVVSGMNLVGLFYFEHLYERNEMKVLLVEAAKNHKLTF